MRRKVTCVTIIPIPTCDSNLSPSSKFCSTTCVQLCLFFYILYNLYTFSRDILYFYRLKVVYNFNLFKIKIKFIKSLTKNRFFF